MNKEMVDMTNREILVALMGRMGGVENSLGELNSKIDSVESSLNSKIDGVENSLSGRIDGVETGLNGLNDRIDTLETNINMEIQAVRTEMEVVNKLLKQDIRFLNDKIDRIIILKDVEGIEKMKIRMDVLEQGYQTLRAKMG